MNNILPNEGDISLNSISFSSLSESQLVDVYAGTIYKFCKSIAYSKEDAASLLGKDFRLPAVHENILGKPQFQPVYTINNTGTAEAASNFATFHYPNSELHFQVENNYFAGDRTMFFPDPTDPEIETTEIAGIKIYRITLDNQKKYLWEHDDLFYYLTSRKAQVSAFMLSDEQIDEIIRSMIEWQVCKL